MIKELDLEETVNKLKEFIYPPGYVEHDSDFDDLESHESQKSNKELQQQKKDPPKFPNISSINKLPPSSFIKPPKTNINAPFISNLNPTEPIKWQNWTPEQDKKLLEIVFTKNLTPNYAALYLKGRTPAACSRRFSRLKQDYSEDQWSKLTRKPKSIFKKNPKHWDLKQDSQLMQGIKLFGTKWSIIAKEVFNGERTPGAISDRFRVLRRRCGYIENGHGDDEDVELVNQAKDEDN